MISKPVWTKLHHAQHRKTAIETLSLELHHLDLMCTDCLSYNRLCNLLYDSVLMYSSLCNKNKVWTSATFKQKLVGEQLRRCRGEGKLNGGKGERKGKQLPLPSFPPQILDCQKIVEKFFLSENFCPRMQNLGETFPFWKKIMDKFKILSPHILVVGNLQPGLSVRILILISCSPINLLPHVAAAMHASKRFSFFFSFLCLLQTPIPYLYFPPIFWFSFFAFKKESKMSLHLWENF